MKIIKKNKQFIVKGIIGETAEALITRLENGKYKLNCNAYVVAKYCKDGILHLYQAREVIPGKKFGKNIKFWPRLRKALHKSGIKSIVVPGGDYPIHYRDEIVIPDYSKSGSRYFIIMRSDIGTYLKKFPLDEAGKARKKLFRSKQIAFKIGQELWYSGGYCMKGEFQKITLISNDDSKFSVIYPSKKTDLIWPGCSNVPKVLCTAPETGIEYLSGFSAGHLDPKKHYRLKRFYSYGWSRDCAYLMPNPTFATEVREHYRWLAMFDNSDNDGISPELIASSKKIILEAYDLYDKLLKERYVYHRETEEVTKEYLHNWPFDLLEGKIIGDFDWRTEKNNKFFIL